MNRHTTERRRACCHCGGAVETITVPPRRLRRQPHTRIGACVRCAQWFEDRELGVLDFYDVFEPGANALVPQQDMVA